MLIRRIWEVLRPPSKKQKQLLLELRSIAAGDKPIVFGPFFTEIGFEVLYWIPFISWFKERYKIPSDRIIAVSRGGGKCWYHHITRKYFDIFDFYSLEEFKRKNDARIEANKRNHQPNAPKHLTVSDLDREILGAVARSAGISDYGLLHPSHMFRFMSAIRNSPELAFTRYRPFHKPKWREELSVLPKEYIAVKFWFGGQFKDTDENKHFIRNLIELLAKTNNVVLLNTGLELERHDWFDRWFNDLECSSPNVYSARKFCTLQNNLEVQSAIIARSKSFVGTYGGFAYAAPFLGVPAVTFFSNEEGFVYEHLDMLRRALRSFRLETGESVDLLSFDVKTFDRVANGLFGMRLSPARSGAEASLAGTVPS